MRISAPSVKSSFAGGNNGVAFGSKRNVIPCKNQENVMIKYTKLFEAADVTNSLTIIIEYAINIITETSKFFILVLFFYAIDFLLDCYFTVLLVLPTRTFSGSLHMKTKIGGLLFSFVFLFIPIVFSPITTIKRSIVTKARYHKQKLKTAISVSAIFLILSSLFLQRRNILFINWGLDFGCKCNSISSCSNPFAC